MRVSFSKNQRSRFGSGTLRCTGAVLLCMALAACDRSASTPEPLTVDNLQASITPELARELGPDGRFILPAPPHESYPQITAEEAAAQALAFTRKFAPFSRPYLEREHGRRIDFAALTIGSPAYYAASPYDPVPARYSPGFRNGFGPHYLVYLVEGDRPVLSVAVAAFGESQIVDGELRLPMIGGMEFTPAGIRPGDGFSMPLSPEAAVHRVSSLTGARASALPELVMPYHEFAPQFARWKITLDRPVSARTRSDGSTRSTREVYVGLRGEIAVPADDQPSEVKSFEPGGERYTIPRRANRPVMFVPVTLSAG